MLVELGLVEQRHAAVLEVLEGVPVTEVAVRFGVSRQTVHRGGGEVTIHGRDGKIRDSDTVPPGNDPHPPKDAK